jgi:hypothetical protein
MEIHKKKDLFADNVSMMHYRKLLKLVNGIGDIFGE